MISSSVLCYSGKSLESLQSCTLLRAAKHASKTRREGENKGTERGRGEGKIPGNTINHTVCIIGRHANSLQRLPERNVELISTDVSTAISRCRDAIRVQIIDFGVCERS